MQPENYIFLEIHNWCKWLDCNMGEVAKNYKFLHIPYSCKFEQLDTRQCNGTEYSEMEMCMWNIMLRLFGS